ncbi:MAG: hypothetical protein AB4058_04490 [Microcystaceae cyanobacterium]
MKSIITSVLMKADTNGRFLNDHDCQTIANRLSEEEKRLDLAAKLADLIEPISQKAGDALVAKYPELQQPGQCGETPKKVKHWYQDIKDYLRVITYCLILRSPDPIYHYNGRQVGEFFRALNVPLSSCIDGLTEARELLLASGEIPSDMEQEVNGYFDKLIATFV